MRVYLRRLFLPVLFIAVVSSGVFLRPAPAAAACCNIGVVETAVNKVREAVDAARDAIVKALVNAGGEQFLYRVSWYNGPDNLISGSSAIEGANASSLVHYFETVYWPRFIAVAKSMKAQDAETAAVDMTNQTSIADAQNQIQYMQQMRMNNVQGAMESAGRVDVLCDGTTQMGVMSGMHTIVRMLIYSLHAQDIDEMEGDSAYQDSANGIVAYNRKQVQKRAELGVCNPRGNNGANAVWCTNANADIENADINPQTLFTGSLMSDDPKDRNYSGYVKMYIKNLFPVAFTPLRKDQMKGTLSNQVAELLADRHTYAAQVSTLKRPFFEAEASAKGIEKIDQETIASYKSILEDVGLINKDDPNDTLGKLFVSDDKMSKQGAEELLFRTSNLNPKALNRMAGLSVMNIGNALSFSIIKQMETVAMLYDLREEQRETNRLLGTIGSLLAKEAHDRLEGKIRAVAATGN